MLEFRILGPLDVSVGTRSCALRGPRERALLAYLLLHANEVVPSDRIIDDLWGEEPPRTVSSMLHIYVARLRKALNQHDSDSPGALLTQAPGYVLRIDDAQFDLRRFESLAAAGRRSLADGSPARAAEELRAALALWRGRPLADVPDQPWVTRGIARLEESRLTTLEERIAADMQLGRHDDLIWELQELVSEHPYRERLAAHLMLALYRSGRQAEALTVYDEARRRLSRELGLEPGTNLNDLQRAILNHDPQLELTRPVPTTRTIRRGARLRWIVTTAAMTIAAGVAVTAFVSSQSPSARQPLANAPRESVAVIDTHTNRLVDAVPIGGRMSSIARGGGSVWVADFDGKTLLRIDPATAKVVETVALPDHPGSVAVGQRAVWVTTATGHLLLHIDPQYGSVDRRVRLHQNVFEEGAQLGNAVSTGPQGLWVGHDISALTRLDPARGTVLRQLTVDAPVTSVAQGAGEVWVVTSSSHLLAVDPIANKIDTTIPLTGAGGAATVAGGAVWVVDVTGELWRIDTRTRKPTDITHLGNGHCAIASGAGSVWVANDFSGTVSRIDLKSARVVTTIHVGNTPQALAVTADRVWVTVA